MQEFIEKLIGRLEEAVSVYPSGYGCMSYGVRAVPISEVKKIVNQLAEEHNNGWIPCGERLPNLGEKVLASINSPQEHEVIISIYDDRTFRFFKDGTVIAWQPLPAPYKWEQK